jgi:flagellar basal-body rod protein FlgB
MLTTTPTFEVLADAIDRSALKQAVYAANVANANVEGYRRLEVAFDAQLDTAARAFGAPTTFGGAEPTRVVATSTMVKLDEEMALMAKNALQYQTLIGAYEKQLSLLRLAIKEGRE